MYLPTFESRFSPQYIKKSIEISRGETNWGKFIQKGWYVKLQIIMMLDYKSLWYTTCHLLKMTEYPVFGMDPRKTRPHPVFGMDPRKTHPLGPWQHDLKLVLYIENNTVQCIYVWYITIQYIIVQYNILLSAISLLLGNNSQVQELMAHMVQMS